MCVPDSTPFAQNLLKVSATQCITSPLRDAPSQIIRKAIPDARKRMNEAGMLRVGFDLAT